MSDRRRGRSAAAHPSARGGRSGPTAHVSVERRVVAVEAEEQGDVRDPLRGVGLGPPGVLPRRGARAAAGREGWSLGDPGRRRCTTGDAAQNANAERTRRASQMASLVTVLVICVLLTSVQSRVRLSTEKVLPSGITSAQGAAVLTNE